MRFVYLPKFPNRCAIVMPVAPADSADPGFKRLEGLEFRVVSA